ncbi:MAG: hypothetical protein ABI846_04935 [Rudaea sp.]
MSKIDCEPNPQAAASAHDEEVPAARADTPFWWALLTLRGQRGNGATAAIVARHAIPILGLVLLHWSAQTFLLLAVLNFAWNWVLNGVWNTATSALVAARRERRPVPITTWGVMLLVGAALFCILAFAFGLPVYYAAPIRPTFDGVWGLALSMTLLAPLPGLVDLVRAGVAANLSDERIRTIADQRRSMTWVGVVPIVAAFGLFETFPYPLVVTAVAVGYALFSALCELSPDLASLFARELPR